MNLGVLIFLLFFGLAIYAIVYGTPGYMHYGYRYPVNNMTGKQQLELGVMNAVLNNAMGMRRRRR